jgi:hypothetical protein
MGLGGAEAKAGNGGGSDAKGGAAGKGASSPVGATTLAPATQLGGVAAKAGTLRTDDGRGVGQTPEEEPDGQSGAKNATQGGDWWDATRGGLLALTTVIGRHLCIVNTMICRKHGQERFHLEDNRSKAREPNNDGGTTTAH